MRVRPAWLLAAIAALICLALVRPIASASTVAAPGSEVPDGWPQFGFDASHSGHNPAETILNISNVAGLSEAWQLTLDKGFDLSSPVIADGVLYVVDQLDAVHAFDTASGRELWASHETFPHPAGSPFSTPAVAGGLVFMGCAGPSVCALAATTGAAVWDTILGPYTSLPPTVSDGVVFATTEQTIAALAASNGDVYWEVDLDGYVRASAAVADGMVYVGATDDSTESRLYALEAVTGQRVWASPSFHGLPNASPVVADEVVYGAIGPKVLARSADSGARLWTVTLGKSYNDINGLAIADGLLFASRWDGRVTALDTGSGKVKWSTNLRDFLYGAPAVANGVLLVGHGGVADDQGGLHALDVSSGKRLWGWKNDASTYEASPAIANGMVFMTTTAEVLHAFGLGGDGGPAPANPVVFVHGLDLRGRSGQSGAQWNTMIDRFMDWGWDGDLRTVGYYEGDTEFDEDISNSGKPDTTEGVHALANGGPNEHTGGDDDDQHNKNTDIRHLAYHWAWYVSERFTSQDIPIDVVAHSMGGLIVRYAIQRVEDGDPDFPSRLLVEDVVTLGTPHGGTNTAGACFRATGVGQCEQTRRNASFIRWLGNHAIYPQAEGGTDWTAIGSDDDGKMQPHRTAADFGADHKAVYKNREGISHDDYLSSDSDRNDASVVCGDRGPTAKEHCDEGTLLTSLETWDNAPWPVRWTFFALEGPDW